ncbi:hypothetical protein FJV41_20850 [Myxococcus llanfairpwllgwyngyllgogerychwyrndrobwllllantysiliogogogochensis]|uniref:Uncharacterized protein n=1 Tax=Myxococcus llanfairpwllgwyngyllgogerychwyrndrobwllllantysiliogogogochensis TaxID=2590453 RepID=A0A540WYM6_9BACT|nr:hypothetical protein [Myxococcus llanfairpwllgwyngyllgogerychwyrndrobwllllantysiliogogogochensis]TQF14050.1 hypothetical protein FJV41_20850 [Myxococcus llanfairpwllgwyngyllgogerychwyrndrobwllllantysiliogogogochensis]
MTLMGHTFRQTLHLARHLSTNAGGESEYSEPEPHRCRCEGDTKRLVTADGSERVSEFLVFTSVAVRTEDRVYPPDADPDDDSAGREPLRVIARRGLSGAVDHYEVYL